MVLEIQCYSFRRPWYKNLDASCLFCLYFVRNMTAQKLREPNLRELVLSSQDHSILTQKKPVL